MRHFMQVCLALPLLAVVSVVVYFILDKAPAPVENNPMSATIEWCYHGEVYLAPSRSVGMIYKIVAGKKVTCPFDPEKPDAIFKIK